MGRQEENQAGGIWTAKRLREWQQELPYNDRVIDTVATCGQWVGFNPVAPMRGLCGDARGFMEHKPFVLR